MEKRFLKMFDDFDTAIQCEELEEYLEWADRFEEALDYEEE